NNKTRLERETNVSLARDCDTVFDAWNLMATKIDNPVCAKRTPKRRASCRARLRQDGLPDILRAIEHVPRSAFLRGDTGNWSGADIDFLLRPDSVTKILEGKYDDRTKQHSPPAN